MKKLLVLLQLVLLSGYVMAEKITLAYIPISSFKSDNTIVFADINDFSRVVEENQIHSIFYTSQYFIIPIDSVMYLIDSNKYKSIADYMEGNSIGFKNGEFYYYAKETKLNNQSEVDYYKQQSFISAADYRDALKSGFVNNNSPDIIQTLTGIFSQNELQANIEYLKMFVTTNATDINSLVQNSGGRIKKLAFGNNYYLNIPVGNPSGYYRGSSRISDSTFYYACKIAGYKTLSDYLARKTDPAFTIKNSDVICKTYGFLSFKDMIDADQQGFASSADFYLAKNYSLSSAELAANRLLINSLETTKMQYRIENNLYAVALIYLLSRPKNIPVSVDVFTSGFFTEYQNNSFVRRMPGFGNFSFDSFYKSIPQLELLITYDPKGKSFYVK